MLTSSRYGAISSIAPSKVYKPKTDRESRVQSVSGGSSHDSYDSVTLSTTSQDSRFHMDMVSRMSQEVRTVTTTGDIAALRAQVASGEYTPNPMLIAARILFLGGAGE